MIPGADLIVGLAIQLLIGIAWWAVKATYRAARCCLIDHPILTGLGFTVAWKTGWIATWVPELLVWAAWFPLFVIGLFLLGVVRWCTPDHTAMVRRHYRQEIVVRRKAAGEHVGGWVSDRVNARRERKAERKRLAKLPPPPAPIPVGPAPAPAGPAAAEPVMASAPVVGGAQRPLDVREVPAASAPAAEGAA